MEMTTQLNENHANERVNKMDKYQCGPCGSTILRWEILTAGLHREQLLKIFRMTGPAQYAVSAKICLRKYNDDENGFGKNVLFSVPGNFWL